MRTYLLPALLVAFVLTACGTSEQQSAPTDTGPPATEPAATEPAGADSSEQQETEQAADGGREDTAAPGEGETASVAIADFAYDPPDLEVARGTTVEWTQMDSTQHTVDFEDGEDSGELAQGDTYSRTFDEAGEYPYVCFFHPQMTATVTVTE